MYLFYEHHRKPNNPSEIAVTEIKLSSSKDRWFVSFKNTRENTIFEICKTILKWPPVKMRSMDEKNYVWSYFDSYGEQVIQKIKETTVAVGGITCIELEDLAEQATQGVIRLDVKRKKVSAEEFFYSQGVTQSAPVLTKEEIMHKLAAIMEVPVATFAFGPTEIKKAYRRAALRLHPDRNQGDGSRMSDLNMYWGLYNG